MTSSSDDNPSIAPNRKSSNGLFDALALNLPDDPVSSPISSSTSSSFSNFVGAGVGSSSSPIRLSSFQRSNSHFGLLSGHNSPRRKMKKKGARVSHWKRFRGLILIAGLVSLFFLVNWWILHRINNAGLRPKASSSSNNNPIFNVIIKEDLRKKVIVKKPQKTMFGRLLALAAHALAEGQNKPEPKGL